MLHMRMMEAERETLAEELEKADLAEEAVAIEGGCAGASFAARWTARIPR
jgi:hypothetical protein